MKEKSKRDLFAGVYLKLTEKEIMEVDKLKNNLGVSHKDIYTAGLDVIKEAYKKELE